MADQFIERRIITGLIISTEYLNRIHKFWDSKLLESRTAKKIASWCWEFYEQYHTAPAKEIESIFVRKTKNLEKEEIQDVEDILESLSEDYERGDKFNVPYLFDQTIEYFEERNLNLFLGDVKDELDQGNVNQAKSLAYQYKPADISLVDDSNIDLSNKEVLKDSIHKAFLSTSQPVVTYPRQLGSFMNEQLIRGAFVAFMAPEKRGKTYLLMDMAIRAARQGSNVAFFQAGDMTQEQQLKRICIHLAKRSDNEKYSGKMYEPVRDCIWNQLDQCDLKQRECDYGPFEDKWVDSYTGDKLKNPGVDYIRNKIELKELRQVYKKHRGEYKPCHNCSKYWKSNWGAVWLKQVDTGSPLTEQEAKKFAEKFFVKGNRRFKLSTHPSRTLTVTEIDRVLDLWEREDGFVSDLVIIDYADIMQPEIRSDFRHQENDRWMKLRGLSERRHVLVVTATQTDTRSYEKDRLSMQNFSEDKRKFAHVTAMYGLNQDRKGREKELGIMRINEIVIREGDFSSNKEVYILQNLKRGQPVLSSFW